MPNHSKENSKGMELIAGMLTGSICELKPQLDFNTEFGFFYPSVEKSLGLKGQEVIQVLECLVSSEILEKKFFDRMLHCPQCQSVLLRPTTHCPKCASGHITSGRILEHMKCKYTGLEEEFVIRGAYVCPNCKLSLKTPGVDYESLGLLYKCHNCQDIFQTPAIKWRCLNCKSITPSAKVVEVDLYSYKLDEEKRGWLEFELRPKAQLIEFLKNRGYEVVENATVKGRSGVEHKIDILVTRDDGIINYSIAIGIKVSTERVKLAEIFDFDQKAYDSGIHNKVLIVLSNLGKEAEAFAALQRIKVLEVCGLEKIFSRALSKPDNEIKSEPFAFRSKTQLVEYLIRLGYQVEEDIKIKGRSGGIHNVDMLAVRDDGLITHRIIISIEMSGTKIGLEKIFDFDDKAYDIGIMDKVFVVSPGLTPEAMQFAQRQKIRVLEAGELELVS